MKPVLCGRIRVVYSNNLKDYKKDIQLAFSMHGRVFSSVNALTENRYNGRAAYQQVSLFEFDHK